MVDFQKIHDKINKVQKYLEQDIYEVVGTEAVNHFQDSFQKGGFTDQNFEPWKEVERRKPESPWFGFKYKSKSPRPGQKKRNPDSTTNFSQAATKRPILSGETQELMNSLQYQAKTGTRSVRIYSDKIYAQLQNEGGPMKIFGKGGSTMPARKYMGASAVLTKRIQSEVKRDISRILNT